MRMRWDGARKRLVPFEKAAANEMLKSIPEKAQAGKTTVINNLDTSQDIYTETSTDIPRPPCCRNCNGPEQLVVGVLHLKNNTATINVLIDTGCLQTNVVSARVAALLRQDGIAPRRRSTARQTPQGTRILAKAKRLNGT
jgi:hypothetical protein